MKWLIFLAFLIFIVPQVLAQPDAKFLNITAASVFTQSNNTYSARFESGSLLYYLDISNPNGGDSVNGDYYFIFTTTETEKLSILIQRGAIPNENAMSCPTTQLPPTENQYSCWSGNFVGDNYTMPIVSPAADRYYIMIQKTTASSTSIWVNLNITADPVCPKGFTGPACALNLTSIDKGPKGEIPANQWMYYKLVVPELAGHLTFQLSCAANNATVLAQMFLRYGNIPLPNVYDYNVTCQSTGQELSLLVPNSPNWYLGLLGADNDVTTFQFDFGAPSCPDGMGGAMCTQEGPVPGAPDSICLFSLVEDCRDPVYQLNPGVNHSQTRMFNPDPAGGWTYFTVTPLQTQYLLRIIVSADLTDTTIQYTIVAKTGNVPINYTADYALNQFFAHTNSSTAGVNNTYLYIPWVSSEAYFIGIYSTGSSPTSDNTTFMITLDTFTCPGNCNGQGRCNNDTNLCTCNTGFTADEFCNAGHVKKPNKTHATAIILGLLFGVVFPLIAIAVVLYLYFRWKKSKQEKQPLFERNY